MKEVKIKITQLDKNDLVGLKKFITGVPNIINYSHGLFKNDIEFIMSNDKLNDFYLFGIRKSEEIYRDFLIGVILIYNIDWISRHCQVGFILNVNLELNETNNHIVSWILDFVFDELNMNKVAIEIIQKDDAKVLLEALGFVPDGVRRSSIFMDGKFIDTMFCSLLRASYDK